MIDYHQHLPTLWPGAIAAPDREIYISEWSTSIIWGEPETLSDDDLLSIAEHVGRIWDAAHMTMLDIRTAARLTQCEMSHRLCIPRRTIENWSTGDRTPPDYVRLLILKDLDLL